MVRGVRQSGIVTETRTRVMSRFSVILLACLTCARSLLAWNGEGHMTVALLAYNHLGPVAKVKCDALINVNLGSFSSTGTSNFVTAAVWADDFKTALGTGGWHYIDIPISLDGTSTNGNFYPVSSNVAVAINICLTNLQNTSLTDSNRAMALRYLIHFCGDITQPLHDSTAVWSTKTGGDAGGNGFSLTASTWSNLHSLWDAGGGYLTDSVTPPLDSTKTSLLSNKVVQIEADYPYDYTATPVPLTNAMNWAVEGWNIARTNSYVGITYNGTPTTDYLNKAIATTEQRMAVGGHRLADMLNTLFPTYPAVLGGIVRTNGNIRFSWGAVTNVTYRVQSKQNLTDATWTDVTNIIATSGSVLFEQALGTGQRFYRVVQ
jgi:hypothetical protein